MTAMVPLFVFDAGYDGIALGHGLADTRAQVLVRIASTRVFHPDPESPTTDGRGRPPRHGPRFVLSDEETWPTPRQRTQHHRPPLREGKGDAPGTTCIRSSMGGDAGATVTNRRSSKAVSSGSRSNTCPNQQGGSKRHCGCGGQAKANPTSTCAGAPTSAGSTSSTPSGS